MSRNLRSRRAARARGTILSTVVWLALAAGCATPPSTASFGNAERVPSAPDRDSPGSTASADDVNKSNNPLNPSPAVNIQDYSTPDIYGSDAHTNDVLLRGTLPIRPGVIPFPQIVRVTAPISTRPDPDGGYTTGIGDVNIFDILLLGKSAGFEFGAGPLITVPTAVEDELGSSKWQAGVAALAIRPSPEGILGGLLQWQSSFAGQSNRPDVQSLTAQPLAIYNLPQAWYLRTTGIWTFNLENGDYYIPLGIGAGKVWKVGRNTLNAFLEPQWTVAHEGDGLPEWTLFFGLNVTIGSPP